MRDRSDLYDVWVGEEQGITESNPDKVTLDRTPVPEGVYQPTVSEDLYMTDSFRNMVPDARLRHFNDLFQKVAADTGADPVFLKALAGAESDGDPYAVSGAGAEGLMQITPVTATQIKQLAAKAGRHDLAEKFDPKDPEHAIIGAALYTRWLEDRVREFAGDDKDKLRDLVLAAYNAGPGKVRQHKGDINVFKETKQHRNRFHDNYKKFSKEGDMVTEDIKKKDATLKRDLALMLGIGAHKSAAPAGEEVWRANQAAQPTTPPADSGEFAIKDIAAPMTAGGTAVNLAALLGAGILARRGMKGIGKGYSSLNRYIYKPLNKLTGFAEYQTKALKGLGTPGGFKNPKERLDAMEGILAAAQKERKYLNDATFNSLLSERNALAELVNSEGSRSMISKYLPKTPQGLMATMAGFGLAAKAPDVVSNIFGGGDRKGRGAPVIING